MTLGATGNTHTHANSVLTSAYELALPHRIEDRDRSNKMRERSRQECCRAFVVCVIPEISKTLTANVQRHK